MFDYLQFLSFTHSTSVTNFLDSLLCLENGIRNLKIKRPNWQYSFEVQDRTMVSIISALHSQKIACPNNSSKESDWWNQLRMRAMVNTSFQDFVFHTKAHQHTGTPAHQHTSTLGQWVTNCLHARWVLNWHRGKQGYVAAGIFVDFLRKWFRKKERSVCCVKKNPIPKHMPPIEVSHSVVPYFIAQFFWLR